MRRLKMSIRNALIIGVIAILVGTIIFYLANNVANTDSSTKPEWKEGDYWEYSCIHNTTIGIPQHDPLYNTTLPPKIHHINETYIYRETVIGNTTITIDNETYDVILSEGTCGSFTNGALYPNISGLSYLYQFYYRKSELALVKFMGMSNNSEVIYETIYKPPVSTFDFPLKVGKEWERRTNCTFILDRPEISENIGMGERHTNWHTNFKCLQKTKVSTEIGVFDCYVVKAYNSTHEENYYLSYFSPFAGNIVKGVDYNRGKISSSQELISFSYHGRTHGEENDTPAFELVSFITAIAVYCFIEQRW